MPFVVGVAPAVSAVGRRGRRISVTSGCPPVGKVSTREATVSVGSRLVHGGCTARV